MWFCAADPLYSEGFVQGAQGKQESLWWRWLAAVGSGEKVPQMRADEELEPE